MSPGIEGFPGATVGSSPNAGLVFDAKGSLYSTAYLGGAHDWGTVYELSPVPEGGGNLYGTTDFGGDIHSQLCALYGCGLVFGSDGNLYGTAADGGSSSNGTVFLSHDRFAMTAAGARSRRRIRCAAVIRRIMQRRDSAGPAICGRGSFAAESALGELRAAGRERA